MSWRPPVSPGPLVATLPTRITRERWPSWGTSDGGSGPRASHHGNRVPSWPSGAGQRTAAQHRSRRTRRTGCWCLSTTAGGEAGSVSPLTSWSVSASPHPQGTRANAASASTRRGAQTSTRRPPGPSSPNKRQHQQLQQAQQNRPVPAKGNRPASYTWGNYLIPARTWASSCSAWAFLIRAMNSVSFRMRRLYFSGRLRICCSSRHILAKILSRSPMLVS